MNKGINNGGGEKEILGIGKTGWAWMGKQSYGIFKVGRMEKLAQKPWRKEIYHPVPPRPLHKIRLASTVGYNLSPSKKG